MATAKVPAWLLKPEPRADVSNTTLGDWCR